jgi:hypothetical protein
MVKSIAGFHRRLPDYPKNSITFNDITALRAIVGRATFVDFALTKCDIPLLDSVKGGNQWQRA